MIDERAQETMEILVFAPNSSLGEKIKSAYMPSWVFLGMTAVEERVIKRTTKL
jgi:outer membrane PBP1 activator LpoA protein